MPAIVVTGDKALDRALRGLGPKVANRVAVKALREAARPIKAEVVANAPEGETGDLEASVKLRAGKRSRSGKSIQVFQSHAEFRGDKFYAAFVEFGTAEQPGQRHMTRAYDARKDRARDELLVAIRRGVEAEASAR